MSLIIITIILIIILIYYYKKTRNVKKNYKYGIPKNISKQSNLQYKSNINNDEEKYYIYTDADNLHYNNHINKNQEHEFDDFEEF